MQNYLRLCILWFKQVGKIVCVGIKISKKEGLCESWNIKVKEQIFFMQGLQQVRNIVYTAIEAKCNIFYIKVSLEAIFFEMIRANKVFIFRKGIARMNILHLSLSKSFALSICSRYPMKNSILGYFCKSTYSKMHC